MQGSVNRTLGLFLGLPLLSGVLFWWSWPPMHTAIPIFFAFVPLLFAERLISDSYTKYTGLKVWFALFLGLLVWNLATTWWVQKASVAGGLFANIANPILMTIPLMLMRKVRLKFGKLAGYLAFVVFWMSFEKIHLTWELTWPWLTVGNVFAAQYSWVQWYEITGVFGGTLWVLLINIWVFHAIAEYKQPLISATKKKQLIFHVLGILIIIALPILISLQMYRNYQDKGKPVQFTVLQPNYDPYTEKFTIPYRVQMEEMLRTSLQHVNSETDFLIWPETAIQTDVWLDKLSWQKPVRDISKAIDSFPNLVCLIGINGYEKYPSADKATATARHLEYASPVTGKPDTIYFDVYNTALALNSEGPIGYYHKSKLVPGVERMPYPEYMKLLNYFTINLGGIEGSLGIQKDRTVFFNKDSVGIAPVICYESIFGEYVGDYINKGANIICIITNDGWWGDTDGYKQHCMYASLRAIESRRAIARSANTGVSCFIDQRGDISQAQPWNVQSAISASLPANSAFTFYTRHGDYLARFALWLSGGMLVILLIQRLLNKFSKRV